jgi:tRNA A-37 threonylcarbamoyl transferase component Bud32
MGFAPALKGFKHVADGWHMIVMDAITDRFSHVDKPSVSLYEPIKEKVVAFHQWGYVHGDLRDTNLMVRDNRVPEMMLFDFDCVGEIGKVRYPINMNRTSSDLMEHMMESSLLPSMTWRCWTLCLKQRSVTHDTSFNNMMNFTSHI